MEINIYKLFRENKLVSDYKEYSELVRLKCMYVNEERIEIPTKMQKINKKIKNIRVAYNKLII